MSSKKVEATSTTPEQNETDQSSEDGNDDEAGSTTSSPESRLIVVGDSDFASDQYFDLSADGDLFLNMVSWLAEDTDLISIRPKDPKNRSIILTYAQQQLVFWGVVVIFPVSVLIFGLGIWRSRR